MKRMLIVILALVLTIPAYSQYPIRSSVEIESVIKTSMKITDFTIVEVSSVSYEKYFKGIKLYSIDFLSSELFSKQYMIGDGVVSTGIFVELNNKVLLLDMNHELIIDLIKSYSDYSSIQKDPLGFIRMIYYLVNDVDNKTIIAVSGFEQLKILTWYGIEFRLPARRYDEFKKYKYECSIDFENLNMHGYFITGIICEINSLETVDIEVDVIDKKISLIINTLATDLYK